MSESASGGRERSPYFFVKYIFSFGRDLPEAREMLVAVGPMQCSYYTV